MAIGVKRKSWSKSGVRPHVMVRTSELDPHLSFKPPEVFGRPHPPFNFGLVEELSFDKDSNVLSARFLRSNMSGEF